MKVLWLASWYPNSHEPVNGDFIQRHARAVSRYAQVDVVHVLQLGAGTPTAKSLTLTTTGNLREFICSFQFQPTGFGWLDKLRYNTAYLHAYRKFLRQYEQEHGRPDLVHVHVPIKAGIMGRWVARRWKIPYLVSEQASYYEEAAPDNFHRRTSYFRRNAERIFRDADIVTNVSTTIAEKIRQLFGLRKVVTVHNLVETEMFHPVQQNPSSVFTWLHVSALGEQKNIPGMLRAFASLRTKEPGWRLRIVGPHTSAHRELVQQLGLSAQVSFTGELPHATVAKEMQQAGAFVIFSNHENFPCVVVEALCCGLPVIASDAGGVREAVNAENGIIVPVGDESSLANALQKLMQNYRQYNCQRISGEAAAKYAAPLIGSQFFGLYQQLTASKY